MYPHEDAARASVVSALSELGINPSQLSRETGLDIGTIRDFLNGSRWPRPKSLSKIEAYFGWEPGAIENEARGLSSPKRPSVSSDSDDASGVFLDIDPSALAGLDDEEREEVLTAAKLTALSTARSIRRSRE